MKALIVEVPFTLMENAREQYRYNLKEAIKKDIAEDGIVVLFGGLRSYMADVDDIVVKMENEEEHPAEEVKGCRYGECKFYATDFLDPITLFTSCGCRMGNRLDFDEVCPMFISR